MKLDALKFGLAMGIVWAVAVLLMPLMGLIGGWGSALVKGIGGLYIGYQPTIGGAIIGMIWAFFDMGIFGLVIALIYNKLIDLKK
ncbi:bacteriophage holin [Candidatus Margulisiibacteriota bacterium]